MCRTKEFSEVNGVILLEDDEVLTGSGTAVSGATDSLQGSLKRSRVQVPG